MIDVRTGRQLTRREVIGGIGACLAAGCAPYIARAGFGARHGIGLRTTAWAKTMIYRSYKYIGLYVLKIYSNFESFMEIGRIKLAGIDITDSSFVGLGNNNATGELDTYKNVRWRNGDSNNEGPGLYKEDGHNFYSVMQKNRAGGDVTFNSSGGYLAPIQLKNPIAVEGLNGILYEQTGARYKTLPNRRVTDYHFVASADGSTWDSFLHFQKTPTATNFSVIESAALSYTGETFTDLGHFVKTQ